MIEWVHASCLPPLLSVHQPVGSVDIKVRNKSQRSLLRSSLDFVNRASESEGERESVNQAKEEGREEDVEGRQSERSVHEGCEQQSFIAQRLWRSCMLVMLVRLDFTRKARLTLMSVTCAPVCRCVCKCVNLPSLVLRTWC